MDQHAAAVAGQTIRGDAAAMRHPRKRFKRNVDDGTGSGALDLGDEPEAATVVFAGGVVEAPIRACLLYTSRCV